MIFILLNFLSVLTILRPSYAKASEWQAGAWSFAYRMKNHTEKQHG